MRHSREMCFSSLHFSSLLFRRTVRCCRPDPGHVQRSLGTQGQGAEGREGHSGDYEESRRGIGHRPSRS